MGHVSGRGLLKGVGNLRVGGEMKILVAVATVFRVLVVR